MRIYNKAEVETALIVGELEGRFHRAACKCCVILQPEHEFSFVLTNTASRRIHWLSAADWIMGRRGIPDRLTQLIVPDVGDWWWEKSTCTDGNGAGYTVRWRWRHLKRGMYHL